MVGFVYIMSNAAFPNLIKIGKSKKDPTIDRVNELNQTGVPHPFKVEYFALVGDEDGLENALHKKFSTNRPNKNREFFEIKIESALVAINDLSQKFGGIKYEENFSDKSVSYPNFWNESWWMSKPSMVEFFKELEQIKDINEHNETSDPPLCLLLSVEGYGYSQETVEMVKALLNRGADPNATDNVGVYDQKGTLIEGGYTPLMLVRETTEYSLEIEKLLLEAGANPNIVFQGDSALHSAAEFASSESIRLLVSAGADLNIQDENGNPPLFHAADSIDGANIDNIETLLELGANIDHKNKDGNNVLGKILSHPINCTLTELKFLVSCGADLMNVNFKGENLLHLAGRWASNEPDIIQYLFDQGVNPHAVNAKGESVYESSSIFSKGRDLLRELCKK